MTLSATAAAIELFIWPTVAASVAAVPSATLTICRSPPTVPTETVFARSASEPEPSATLSAAVALASAPIATAPVAPIAVLALLPKAMASISAAAAWPFAPSPVIWLPPIEMPPSLLSV